MFESTDPTLFSTSLRMIWGLLIVLGILFAIYGIMRKRLSFAQSNSKSKIQIKEIRHLMPKKSLCLVEVDGQNFLLGIGTDTITLLAPLEGSKDTSFHAKLAVAEQNGQ
ncbi:FliO/MopB family protein [Desulfotalea psychrophila]|nr:FliO/MopB family protein [Desulfocapsa sp.]MBN4071609.1 FliO/MopB family protein [Desulfotalea psychrophila]